MDKIKEIIVVEGRDDTAAIKKSVDAITIETHGYGITKEVWKLIENAYNQTGIIVFTDPDYAGEEIRRRIMRKFPDAKEAFLDRSDACRDGDIGIENADEAAIQSALKKAKRSVSAEPENPYTTEDLTRYGLTGQADSAHIRGELGRRLGIGYGNGKTFLQRLNRFGVSREDFVREITRLREKE